jgi:tetratricopeptide (TPR) repeat protein
MISLGPMLILLLAGCSLYAAQTPAVASQAPTSQSTVLARNSDNLPLSTQETAVGDEGSSSAKLEGAIKAARIARAQAQQRGDRNKEAEAALDEARTIELWAAVDAEGVTHLPQAADAYRVAMERGSVQQRALAGNNLGVLLLRQGELVKSLGVFRQLDLNSVAPADAYLYQFNYGRALELNQDKEAAFARYHDAIELRPDFTPAVEGAFRILWEQKPAPIRDVISVTDILVRGGRSDLAREELKRSLVRWSEEPDAGELLGELVRSYAASAFSPASFQKDLTFLKKLQSVQLKLGITELSLAYSGQFPPSYKHAPKPFTYWGSGGYREPFAKLLKTIGDHYSVQENYAAALACYSNAWGMGRLPDAALYTATLLRDHHELDPQEQLLNRLIDSLFPVKRVAYAKQDWPNILRLHVVLATIFESQSQLGSSSNPRSAIFQWEHARAARLKLSSETGSYPPSPGLDLHLANCYRAVGRFDDADREYLAAAKGYEQALDPEKALLAYRRAYERHYEQGAAAAGQAQASANRAQATANRASQNATQRGVQDMSSSPTSSLQPGPYYALVIGNNNYRYLNKLQTSVNDANAVAQLLREGYGFQTTVLLDADRDQILTALVEYRTTLPENSNLLIYYAGHCHHDRDTDEAYWLPVNAQADNSANWISADDITRDVRAIPSAHVLVISDSCYSGYLVRAADAAIEPKERGAYLKKMLKSKSRNLMSSGGDEPVADSGAPGHSVFAWAILESLRQMEDDNFTAADLFQRFIQPGVGGRSDQLPQYSLIRNSGHEYGDFVFSRSSGSVAAVTAARVGCEVNITRPRTGDPVGGEAVISGDAQIPEGTNLWVFLHRVGLAIWWPQGGGPAAIKNDGRWKVLATLDPNDQNWDTQYEVSALVLDAAASAKLDKWYEDGQGSGSYHGIRLPASVKDCAPVTITVTKEKAN